MPVPDNYDLYKRHEMQQYMALKRRPKCSNCDEHIEGSKCYLINDVLICPDCLERDFKKDVEDYMDF